MLTKWVNYELVGLVLVGDRGRSRVAASRPPAARGGRRERGCLRGRTGRPSRRGQMG